MGIDGIEERVRLLAGRMEIGSEPPDWATVYRIEFRTKGART